MSERRAGFPLCFKRYIYKPNSSWAEGPEGFLLTDDERSRFEALQTDGEVEEFIGLFWARRDPDLGTFENEREIDFTARVEAADMQFGEPERRGALSDRGQVLILLWQCGPRDNHVSNGDIHVVDGCNNGIGVLRNSRKCHRSQKTKSGQ